MVIAPSLDAKEDVEKLRHERGITEYAMLSDAQETFDLYGVRYMPTAYLVGKDGTIRWQGDHVAAAAAEIEKALAE